MNDNEVDNVDPPILIIFVFVISIVVVLVIHVIHCASSGEAKWIQNTIIGNLYSEYHQKLYWGYSTFLQDLYFLNHWEHSQM